MRLYFDHGSNSQGKYMKRRSVSMVVAYTKFDHVYMYRHDGAKNLTLGQVKEALLSKPIRI